MSATAFIAIGSNLGDRLAYCTDAVAGLHAHAAITVVTQSTWREYPALTLQPAERQPDYLNGVVQVQTELSPERLLAVCLELEHAAGRLPRTATPRWAPRTLDLDLLAYDARCLATPTLTLPHPELHKRRFVLEPLCEIAPDWVHPQLQRTARNLLEDVLCNSS